MDERCEKINLIRVQKLLIQAYFLKKMEYHAEPGGSMKIFFCFEAAEASGSLGFSDACPLNHGRIDKNKSVNNQMAKAILLDKYRSAIPSIDRHWPLNLRG